MPARRWWQNSGEPEGGLIYCFSFLHPESLGSQVITSGDPWGLFCLVFHFQMGELRPRVGEALPKELG